MSKWAAILGVRLKQVATNVCIVVTLNTGRIVQMEIIRKSWSHTEWFDFDDFVESTEMWEESSVYNRMLAKDKQTFYKEARAK